MNTINVRCEINQGEFIVKFNPETSNYETTVTLHNGDVRIFNIKSIQIIDDMAIIEGKVWCVDEKGVGYELCKLWQRDLLVSS